MKKLAAIFALLIFSISTAASASDGLFVLCVEKGGTISVEYATGVRCDDQNISNSSAGEVQAGSGDAVCANCRDSVLTVSTFNAAPQNVAKALAAQPAVEPVAVITHPVFTALNGLRAPPGDSPPVQSAYLIQRPTIVILQ